MLFNGELTKNATSLKKGSFLDSLLSTGRTTTDRVNGLYLAGLGRKPTKKELQLAGSLFRAREGKEGEMLQDVWWAILNSNEFILQH